MDSGLHFIPLKGRRWLLAGVSFSRRRSRHWLVFVPESGSHLRLGQREELKDLVGARLARRLNFLVINKSGLDLEGEDRDVFERSFRRARRIEDALAAIKTVIPRGAVIHLVGYSEGAYLVPQIARGDKRVQTITMIGGGTRGWLKEELNNASRRDRPAYQRMIREICRKPSADRRWNGFSYATWYSYRGDHTLHALRGLRIPICAILGARDRVIDLSTTIVDVVLISERQPTHVHIFGDCGHHFTKHWPQVQRVLGRFIGDQTGY